ncbi:TPA: hypothetical protein EYQ19_03110 [Candidatus Pacearchaeota archaeon]|nr:hypothetical protein [Candidatus Pacearchaeota archaeon]
MGLLIVILVIFLSMVVLYKTTGVRFGNLWTYGIAFMLIFSIFTFVAVSKENELNINSYDGFLSATKVYLSWFTKFIKEVPEITGDLFNIDSTEEIEE